MNRRKELPREHIFPEPDCPTCKPYDKVLDADRTRRDDIRHTAHHHADAGKRTTECRNRRSRRTPSECQRSDSSREARRRNDRAARLRIDAVKCL